MGVGPVAIISQLLASSIPACSKICFHNATASKIVFNITDPYPNCPLSVKDCPLPKSDKWTWNPDYQYMASSVALFSGILMVILAPVLGWCMSFVPRPVTMGFTTGGGIMIALGQVKDVYGNGIAIRKDTLQVGIPDMCNYIGNVHGTTFGMGFGAAVFLFFMRKLGQGKIFWWKIEGMPKWVIAISLLPWPFGLVLLYTAVNASSNLPGVAIVGVVPPGLPPMSVPPNFNDSIPKLLSVTVLIIIVGYLESIAVETKFANQFKYQINPTQESFAQGWANIFAGLTSSYPAVGSFSRSATNAAYGAKSPVCNFVTAMVIMICLLAMTQYLYNMPKVILASIVIVAALSLVEWPEFVYLLRKRRFFDFVTMVVTFCFTCFYSLEMGVYVGFCVSVFVILFKSTRPRTLAVNDRLILMYLPGSTGFRNAEEDASSNPIVKLAEGLEPHILVCSIEGDFTFSCAGQCKRIISTKFPLLYRQLGTTKVVLDLTLAYVADSTSVKTLTAMIEDILSHDIAVCLIAQSKVVDCIEPVPGVDLFASFAALEKSGWLIQPPGQTEIAGGRRARALSVGGALFFQTRLCMPCLLYD